MGSGWHVAEFRRFYYQFGQYICYSVSAMQFVRRSGSQWLPGHRSVRDKSSPLKRRGKPEERAVAQEIQTPKFSAAGARPLPKRRKASAASFQCVAVKGRTSAPISATKASIIGSAACLILSHTSLRGEDKMGFEEGNGTDRKTGCQIDAITEQFPTRFLQDYSNDGR